MTITFTGLSSGLDTTSLITDLVRFSQPTREIWAFVRVAVVARPGEVGCYLRPAMFLSDDVIDLKRKISEPLRKVAIFAAAAGTCDHQLAEGRFHRTTRG